MMMVIVFLLFGRNIFRFVDEDRFDDDDGDGGVRSLFVRAAASAACGSGD